MPGNRSPGRALTHLPSEPRLRDGAVELLKRTLDALRVASPGRCGVLEDVLSQLFGALSAEPPTSDLAELLASSFERGQACGERAEVTIEELLADLRLVRAVLVEALEGLALSDASRTGVREVLDQCADQAVSGFMEGTQARTRRELEKREVALTRERRELESKLAELETVIASAPEAIYLGDQAGITRCNQLALEMLGFGSLEELRQNIGRLDDLVENRDPDSHQRIPFDELPFVKALRGERAVRDTEVVHRATGERRIIRGRAAPIRVEGKVVGAVAINSDVTGERRREEELEQALRQRDELLSMASHELRTPLSALLLHLQLLQRTATHNPDGCLRGDDLNRLPQAMRAARRMAEMLDRLLDLSRIRSERFALEVGALELRGLVSETVSRLRPQAEERGASLELREGPELFIYGDALRLEQVVANLISNAVKYGEGKPVEVAVEKQGDDAVIAVRDHGMGIPNQDQARIFERFERATDAQRTQSLGLGLFISREIVKAHGGTIEVESSPGQGALFRVRLPSKKLT